MEETSYTASEPPKKKKNEKTRYVIYVLVVLIATGLSLFLSLYGNFEDVGNTILAAFANPRGWLYILIISLCVFASYLVDALIILVFCRLYTRDYHYHQALATSLIGQFYSDVTPGASGGQVMQAYTMKSQGIPVSSAASIMVMWFILYQAALIIFDFLSFGFEFNSIMSINSISFNLGDWYVTIPMPPLIIIGFLLNFFTIGMLMLMSYSHHIHNFILHYVIGFLGKIHILKNPDKTRETLRVQVENFKIELRRLQANIPVVILQIILFLLMLLLRFCIPYLAGLAMGMDEKFSWGRLFDAAFLSAFHQMVSGIIPLPGSAGVSELVYSFLFGQFFGNNQVLISSSLILWRAATFHVVMLASGLVAAFYRSRPKESISHANYATFVTMQLETYDERKRSADTMYETAQLSRRELQAKLTRGIGEKRKEKQEAEDISTREVAREINLEEEEAPKEKAKPQKQKKPKKAKIKKSKLEEGEDWDSLDI